MNKLQKLAPAWHAEAVGLLKDNFAKIHSGFLDSTKKAVWLGIFLNQIKARGKQDKSIPHGGFGPWLQQNLPDIVWHEANVYMRLARDVCEKGKFQIGDFHQFARSGELPEPVLKIIEGKTQQQLFLEFKQVKLNDDGEYVASPGRRAGEGGYAGKATDVEGRKRYVLRHVGRAVKELNNVGPDIVLLTRNQRELLLSDLERRTKILQASLRTAEGRMDLEEIQTLWKNS